MLLSGPPDRVATVVTVENTTGSRLPVRRPVLHLSSGTSVPATGAALVGAGSTVPVPVSAALDPATPPGSYDAELEVAGTRRRAVVQVEERVAVRVSPAEVVVTDVGTSPLELRVSNDGNTPVTLAATVAGRARDDGPEPGPDLLLDLGGTVTVPPGGTVVVSAGLVVPDGLDPRRRHTARLPVAVADLTVIVLPRTTEETP
mgnify:CR=1 FL=1